MNMKKKGYAKGKKVMKKKGYAKGKKVTQEGIDSAARAEAGDVMEGQRISPKMPGVATSLRPKLRPKSAENKSQMRKVKPKMRPEGMKAGGMTGGMKKKGYANGGMTKKMKAGGGVKKMMGGGMTGGMKKKGYSVGGKVRGAGIARKGVRKARMVYICVGITNLVVKYALKVNLGPNEPLIPTRLRTLIWRRLSIAKTQTTQRVVKVRRKRKQRNGRPKKVAGPRLG